MENDSKHDAISLSKKFETMRVRLGDIQEQIHTLAVRLDDTEVQLYLAIDELETELRRIRKRENSRQADYARIMAEMRTMQTARKLSKWRFSDAEPMRAAGMEGVE